jgi:glycosyltransferase involved in cell wall biosynthesis
MKNGEMGNLWVVVPAYRESAVIADTLDGLRPFLPRVVVVDDGSADDTGAVAARAGARVVRHATNLGQGAALATGIAFALRRGATHVCTFDADGQHDPATIGLMLDAAERGVDVVLTSRFLGSTEGLTPVRRAVLWLALLFTRIQTGLRITDTHNGLRLFTRHAAESIEITQPGMAHASEILDRLAAKKLSYVEIPTHIRYSPYSKKKGQNLLNSVKIAFDLFYASWSR